MLDFFDGCLISLTSIQAASSHLVHFPRRSPQNHLSFYDKRTIRGGGGGGGGGLGLSVAGVVHFLNLTMSLSGSLEALTLFLERDHLYWYTNSCSPYEVHEVTYMSTKRYTPTQSASTWQRPGRDNFKVAFVHTSAEANER